MDAGESRQLIEPEGFGPVLREVLAHSIQPGRRWWPTAAVNACEQPPHRQGQPDRAIALTSESPDHRRDCAPGLWALQNDALDSC